MLFDLLYFVASIPLTIRSLYILFEFFFYFTFLLNWLGYQWCYACAFAAMSLSNDTK